MNTKLILTYLLNTVFFLLALYISKDITNWKSSLLFLVTAGTIGYVSEYIGINTGFPFGNYKYNNNKGVLIGGVPLNIPIIYSYFSLGIYLLTKIILNTTNTFWISLVVSLIATTKDVATDPLRSTYNDIWCWFKPDRHSSFLGVPFQNFIGWIGVFFLTTLSGIYMAGWENVMITKDNQHGVKGINLDTQRKSLLFITLLYLTGIAGILKEDKSQFRTSGVLLFLTAVLSYLVIGWSRYYENKNMLGWHI